MLKQSILYPDLNSDRGKLYIEIVYLDDINNFVVQIVSIWIHFDAQMNDTMIRFKIQILELNSLLTIWASKWFQMKKVWTTKLLTKSTIFI
jgi:hypothetical protein